MHKISLGNILWVTFSVLLAVTLSACTEVGSGGNGDEGAETRGSFINTKTSYDDGNDGTIDRVEYYTYDADGNMKKMVEDKGNDGTIDTVAYYTWEERRKTDAK